MRKAIYLFTLIILTIIISRYSHTDWRQESTNGAWQYSDLRMIDPIDARETGPEIIAVLSQFDVDILKIRIDILKLLIEQNYDLLVFIDAKPGGNLIIDYPGFGWDYLIKYTNSGMARIYTRNNDEIRSIKLRISKDLTENYLQIALGVTDQFIDEEATFLLYIVDPQDSALIIDRAGPILISGLPPPPIEVSFLFWNVVDSSTPATILRSWAGAHTGPQSSRHGLSYLLFAAEKWGVPINICNLSEKDIAFALKYLGVWSFIADLKNNGLLCSIDSCSGDLTLDNTSEFITSNIILEDQSILISRLINLHSAGSNTQLFIGGDLSISGMGSPEAIQALFSYIASHPWIRISENPDAPEHFINTIQSPTLVEKKNRSTPYTVTGIPIVSGFTDFDIQTSIIAQLATLPKNSISYWADQMYQNIITSDEANVYLSSGSYLSQIGHFFEAAYWAENPKIINTCLHDIDWDGQSECILASTDTFLSFELDGGYLAFAFHINSNGIHQIIGPTTQFGILRSDPSVIAPNRGIASDPGQIIGAFADPIPALGQYIGYSSSLSQIDLVSLDGTVRKSFSIQDGGIHVNLSGGTHGEGTIYKLPIVLDPWLIYTSSIDIFHDLKQGSQWIWIADGQISLTIDTNTSIQHYTFNDTYDALSSPEDPNFDYTLGHLLPIPMALIEFIFQPVITIDLDIDP